MNDLNVWLVDGGGCNIGAGLTDMSTGSIRTLTALLAIVAGMLLGIVLLTRTEKVHERDCPRPHAHPVGISR